MREHGIDVVACCAGGPETPGYARTFKRDAPAMMSPEKVAERTLDAIRRGPLFAPGLFNRVAQVWTRLVPGRAMIRTMAWAMKDLCRL